MPEPQRAQPACKTKARAKENAWSDTDALSFDLALVLPTGGLRPPVRLATFQASGDTSAPSVTSADGFGLTRGAGTVLDMLSTLQKQFCAASRLHLLIF
jgi:hypothetical protein